MAHRCDRLPTSRPVPFAFPNLRPRFSSAQYRAKEHRFPPQGWVPGCSETQSRNPLKDQFGPTPGISLNVAESQRAQHGSPAARDCYDTCLGHSGRDVTLSRQGRWGGFPDFESTISDDQRISVGFCRDTPTVRRSPRLNRRSHSSGMSREKSPNDRRIQSGSKVESST